MLCRQITWQQFFDTIPSSEACMKLLTLNLFSENTFCFYSRLQYHYIAQMVSSNLCLIERFLFYVFCSFEGLWRTLRSLNMMTFTWSDGSTVSPLTCSFHGKIDWLIIEFNLIARNWDAAAAEKMLREVSQHFNWK